MGRLANKVAFLAGATVGIGKVTAELFAREGAKVALSGRRAEGEAVAEAIRKAGGDAIFLQADVTVAESVEGAIRKTVEKFGRLDILFNNAGGSSPQDGRVTEAPPEEFWRVMTLDVFGTWLCCRYGIPELIKAGGGSVINMASMAGVNATPGRDAYATCKGAVITMTRVMAREYVGDRVRVNAIAPAAVATDRVLKFLEVPSIREMINRTQKLGVIDPMEIAYTAVFLGADESRSMTGQTLGINAGMFDN
jgi:NAD(P)-dependent dehydrogenase (short-subunit alcohol dehydrogenase family)